MSIEKQLEKYASSLYGKTLKELTDAQVYTVLLSLVKELDQILEVIYFFSYSIVEYLS